ncbi:hypothetical protein E3V38_04775 [Streptococcus pseudopneumoniae]|nr:hypothetical protein [Streptococcus pseudopneumoniae]TMR51974.1 hypothetical protein E3V14_06425 [Streptococcus pseudopneumoniae]TMR80006.1 hypothetical protein E3V35_06265 [Streptococcus pseudopneumoniae]TMR80789.1 hypothetical protein E3V52_01130 [Streptococcus pseudopneumoniae]TMR83644.1 hypothetical protein E3V38_04775 [Streptococcus pseudopneumoniae]
MLTCFRIHSFIVLYFVSQKVYYSFRSKVSTLLATKLHTERFGLTLSFRRFSSSFYESYPIDGASTSTSLIPQLVQAVILPQHGKSAELKRFGEPFKD